jgi:hypothetical protein
LRAAVQQSPAALLDDVPRATAAHPEGNTRRDLAGLAHDADQTTFVPGAAGYL